MHTPDILDLTEGAALELEAPIAVEEKDCEIPMYMNRNYTINIDALTNAALDDIDAVALITVPSIVREAGRNTFKTKGPTLTECGGGVGREFAQIVAGIDGRPIGVDKVVFFNADPNSTSVLHGTAFITRGCYFSVGRQAGSDRVILIYQIEDHDAFTPPPNPYRDRQPEMVRLICNLVGYQISRLKDSVSQVPEGLLPLYEVTKERMQKELDIPFYMEVMRMVKGTEQTATCVEQMLHEEFPIRDETADTFTASIFREVLDIRRVQHRARSHTDTKPHHQGPLRAVETLALDREQNAIDLSLLFMRADGTIPFVYRLQLTQANFVDDVGRMCTDRGLVLNCTSFDALWSELQRRQVDPVSVAIMCFR